jgi:deazaflavin-dependent oxidoreductase (nitroreductase family)
MVLPRWLARANRRVTNRALGRIPGRISPFVLLHHVGRSTGKHYTVPLAGFMIPDGILLTPTYGPEADWVRDILATNVFTLERRGETHTFGDARLVDRADAWPHLSGFVRLAMRAIGVTRFVVADRR